MIKEDVLIDIYAGRAKESSTVRQLLFPFVRRQFQVKSQSFFSFKRVQLIDLNRKKMSFQENLSI